MERATSPRPYFLTFAGLLVLTTTTLLLSFLHLGHFAVPTAMLIAVSKGALVAFFFMHLTEHTSADRLALFFALVLTAILIALLAADIVTRSGAWPGY
jgi:cytochrome c oxidase subunit 4